MPFRHSFVWLSMALLLLMQGPAAFATVWHVEPDGTGTFPTIQDAINAASNQDVVELGDGTFRGTGNRDVNLLGKVIVVRSASDNPALCILDIEGQLDDNHRGFLLANHEGPGTGFRGFTLRNGCMRGDSTSVGRGGAVYLGVGGGASPFFENMRFEQNTALNGGAVYVHIGSVVRFDDCEFIGNLAFDYSSIGQGGALYLRQSVTTLTRCRFTENQSSDGGGAVAEGGGAVTILDCEFVGNAQLESGPDRGGGAVASGGSAAVSGCRFSNNHTQSLGGYGGALLAHHLEMVDSEFIENFAAPTWGSGGAVSLVAGEPPMSTIDRCKFLRNVGGSHGGAIMIDREDTSIKNCHFEGNSLTSIYYAVGAALWMMDCHAEILECTFVENSGADDGGAVYTHCFYSDVSIAMEGCTLIENSATNGGGIFFGCPGQGSSILRTIIAFNRGGGAIAGFADPPTVACSDIYGNRGGDSLFGIDKGGNFSADPLFCNAPIGDLTISEESPCAPANSGGCGLIGAHPVGCGTVSVEPKSWGQIKGMYR